MSDKIPQFDKDGERLGKYGIGRGMYVMRVGGDGMQAAEIGRIGRVLKSSDDNIRDGTFTVKYIATKDLPEKTDTECWPIEFVPPLKSPKLPTS